MSKNSRHKYSSEDLFKLIPANFKRAEFVVIDEETKSACLSGNVYFIDDDGIKKFWVIYLPKQIQQINIQRMSNT